MTNCLAIPDLNRLVIGLFVLTLVVAVGNALAAEDTMILKDGRTFTGRIVSDNGALVVFETHHRGMVLTGRYQRSDVETLTRGVTVGPSYYALPIIGPIGRVEPTDQWVCAKAFKSALVEVRQAKPEYVVLVIDSNGGSVEEMLKIVTAIEEARDLRFIAYVKRGFSAAAIIAAACPNIFMETNAVIGAAVPWQGGPDGTPKNIEEKFQSGMRAQFRAAADLGGHSPLLILGMMDTDIELEVVTKDGKPCVVEAGTGIKGTPLKDKGRILTLTADEALKCGLSAGTAASLDMIPQLMGIGAWHSAGDRAWFHMINAAKADVWREEQRRVHSRKLAEWVAVVEDVRLQLDQVELKILQVRSRRVLIEQKALELTRQEGSELDSAKVQWERDRRNVPANSWTDPVANAQARERTSEMDYAYHARCESIRTRFLPQINAAKADAKSAEREEAALQQQLRRLQASIPEKPLP